MRIEPAFTSGDFREFSVFEEDEDSEFYWLVSTWWTDSKVQGFYAGDVYITKYRVEWDGRDTQIGAQWPASSLERAWLAELIELPTYSS